MVLSLIDPLPMEDGWGSVWQSGVIASEDWDHSGLIVSMSGNENIKGPVLWVDMPDNDIDTLPDALLLSFVDAIIGFLTNGQNVLIHCNEGKYRSTYMDVAVHMRGRGITLAEAFELVRTYHPIASLRTGTEAQLRRLESEL